MVLFLLWMSISCFLSIGQQWSTRHNVLDSRLPIPPFQHLFHLLCLSWACLLAFVWRISIRRCFHLPFSYHYPFLYIYLLYRSFLLHTAKSQGLFGSSSIRRFSNYLYQLLFLLLFKMESASIVHACYFRCAVSGHASTPQIPKPFSYYPLLGLTHMALRPIISQKRRD